MISSNASSKGNSSSLMRLTQTLAHSPFLPRASASLSLLPHVPLTCPRLSILAPSTRLLSHCSVMAAGDSLPPKVLPFELKDEVDFEQIVSPDGLVSVCGFGSLLSERSARSTFPDLINFRVAMLMGFRRVFAHVAPVFFQRGIAKPETKEISSLSVEPCEGENLVVTTFEIRRSEIPAFIEREHEFRFLAKHLMGCFTLLQRYYAHVIVMKNTSMTDAKEVKRCFLNDMDDMVLRRSGWMIFYHAVFTCATAKNLGEAAFDNFLDHTFLGDRKTSIREYLAAAGSGIMEEEPPQQLKERYGG
ncbi:uncharacterized protein LOC127266452 isoform X3 [Andrographis paniculata]|uniref:uncharacterized protein LOC127266452 isoform X3 n=1 Tax=Andrographis paniculata TaxID=175694 RepID=UPI0021E98CA7|nr:uncharacterized protein LOC127266452 isoform X3 [Andrographis paniculata]